MFVKCTNSFKSGLSNCHSFWRFYYLFAISRTDALRCKPAQKTLQKALPAGVWTDAAGSIGARSREHLPMQHAEFGDLACCVGPRNRVGDASFLPKIGQFCCRPLHWQNITGTASGCYKSEENPRKSVLLHSSAVPTPFLEHQRKSASKQNTHFPDILSQR